jgi:epoxyqueuosine reductase QueG
LETFGLSDSLITAVGKAIRVGSVVAQLRIEPASRPYSDHYVQYLFFTQGICGQCLSRCPAEAITKAGVNFRNHIFLLKHGFEQQPLKT